MTPAVWVIALAEADRIEAGGEIDRSQTVRMLRDHAVRMQNWHEAYIEADDERVESAKKLTATREMLATAGMLTGVCQRAASGQLAANEAIELAHDQAPFRNLMATMYGLGPVGEELPKRRRKAKAGAA